MIAADGDRRLQIAPLDEFIDRFAHLGAFAISQPADARRQTLELHAVARQSQPAIQSLVVREKLQRQVVGFLYVRRVARQRYPAKRTLALTKKRANVFGHETWNFKRIF